MGGRIAPPSGRRSVAAIEPVAWFVLLWSLFPRLPAQTGENVLLAVTAGRDKDLEFTRALARRTEAR
ncbi:hypothetical protein SBA4_580002 [Candidatus Sulfopaludibacter sp. SbA4]|nr:hypothetical protein SBA4_580002 [Candidatus Sulfopaludibacter sp. SbA4]